MENTLEENKKRLLKILYVFVIVLIAYLAILIFSEIKKDSILGESATPATIAFSGHGEVQAVPDIATISFTISKDDKTAKDAQAAVAVVEKNALDFLKTKNVDDKDIQTSNASVYPKYQYQNSICPEPPLMNGGVSQGIAQYCPQGKQVLVGYTASESITVKVRNTDDAGAVMQGLGAVGVSDLNGPNFSIDNPDVVQAQARKLAIDDAKAKAEMLANDLGVSLVKITSFNEGGNYATPMMYANSLSGSVAKAPAPAILPKGQNTITSDVTITYEIR